jgi:hypothetical protein
VTLGQDLRRCRIIAHLAGVPAVFAAGEILRLADVLAGEVVGEGIAGLWCGMVRSDAGAGATGGTVRAGTQGGRRRSPAVGITMLLARRTVNRQKAA